MLAMLIRWLPDLPNPQRLWLANQIVELCSAAVHNRQMCCTAGLLRVAIEVLSASQSVDSYIGADTEGRERERERGGRLVWIATSALILERERERERGEVSVDSYIGADTGERERERGEVSVDSYIGTIREREKEKILLNF